MPLSTYQRYRPRSVHVSTISPESLGLRAVGITNAGIASAVWPSSNLAIFIPFTLPEASLALAMFSYNGATASGNLDVGLYKADGTRIVSMGSTAQAGTSALQTLDITDTTLPGGELLYLAMAMDNTTGTTFRLTGSSNVGQLRACGVMQMATAFPLPATATFATLTSNYAPVVGVAFRSTI